MTTPLLLAAPAITRLGAQHAARRELAKPGYQQARPAWWLRPLRWLAEHIARAWDSLATHTGGPAALSAILLLAAVLVGVVLWRVGPMARRARRAELSFGLDLATTSTAFRADAERYAAEQQWALAVRERLRAISRELEERALVEPRPGRTAYEVAVDGGRALPASATELQEAADRFTRIWYGSTQAGAEDYRRLAEIDAAVHRSRPVPVPT